jgi:hypothetical protein
MVPEAIIIDDVSRHGYSLARRLPWASYNWIVAKKTVPYLLWNRLLGVETPETIALIFYSSSFCTAPSVWFKKSDMAVTVKIPATSRVRGGRLLKP